MQTGRLSSREHDVAALAMAHGSMIKQLINQSVDQ